MRKKASRAQWTLQNDTRLSIKDTRRILLTKRALSVLYVFLAFGSNYFLFREMQWKEQDVRERVIKRQVDWHLNFLWAMSILDMILALVFLVCVFVIWIFFRMHPSFQTNNLALIFKATIGLIVWASRILVIISQKKQATIM